MEMHEQDFEKMNQETKSKMIRGSIWMTVGSFSSRLLGAIYIIPWYLWMGENGDQANSLFTKGYNIYALFLMVSTAGIPGAIAKQIAYYNSLNEYKVSKRLFKRSLMMMGLLGIFFAGVMYLGAPVLAAGDENLIPTMRALSFAVLVFPIMSAFRGFFQGNQDMMPSALSQIVEQIARVFYMLVTVFTIMKIGSGDYVKAVTQSTFAAFLGSLAGLVLLLWFYYRYMPTFKELEAQSSDEISVSPNQLIKEIVREAIPFIIIGTSITLAKIIDQFTFEPVMKLFTNYTPNQLTDLFALFSGNPDKLTMIVISIATSLAVASLPLITESFMKKNYEGLATQMSDNFQLFFFVMIPATFGIILLAEPLNTLFYKYNELGSSLLVQAALVGIVLGFYLLVSSSLQGLYGNAKAIRYLLYGLGVKVVLQLPFIYFFESYGPNAATGIAFIVAGYLTVKEIQRLTHFDVLFTIRRVALISILTLGMLLVAFLVRQFLYLFLSPETKFQSLMLVFVVGVAGVAMYMYLALKLRLADKLLGERIGGLRRKLKIR